MDLTVISRVKALRGITDTGSDALLTQIVTAVSARAEALMGRHTLIAERTEEYELNQGEKIVILRGYPVDSTASATFTYAGLSSDASAVTLTRNTDYALDDESGMWRALFRPTAARPGFVRGTYTGGMASGTATFITAWPDIAGAIDSQVSYEFSRRMSPGGNIEAKDSGATFTNPALDWLDGTLGVLMMHRRSGI